MVRSNLQKALVFLFASLALSAAAWSSPLFYLSDQPLSIAQPGVFSLNDYPIGTTGQLNIYAMTDVQLSGVSLDLSQSGGGIQFSGLNVLNDGRWWMLDGPQVIQDARITSIGGGAIPGLGGNGIGSGDHRDANFDPTSGYLLATVDYQIVDRTRPTSFELKVGRNAVADWHGNLPLVHFGDRSQPAVPGVQSITPLPVIPISPVPVPTAPEPPATLSTSPLFYLSDQPIGEARPGVFTLDDPISGTSGQLNIYAKTDTRLLGVSLDLTETGGGIQFSGLNVVNDGRWLILDGPQVIEDSRITSIGGGAIPGLGGNGIGPGDYVDANFHPESGYLLATVEYQVLDATRPANFELNVGKNAIADSHGHIPLVRFGDMSQPAVPGVQSIIPPPVHPVSPVPVPTPEPVDPNLTDPAPGQDVIEPPPSEEHADYHDPWTFVGEPISWVPGYYIAEDFRKAWHYASSDGSGLIVGVYDGLVDPIFGDIGMPVEGYSLLIAAPTDGDGFAVHPDVTSFDFLSRFQGTSGGEFVSTDSDQRSMLLRELQHLAYAQKYNDARTYLAAGIATGALAAANAVSAPEPSSAFLACAIAACVMLVSRYRTAAR